MSIRKLSFPSRRRHLHWTKPVLESLEPRWLLASSYHLLDVVDRGVGDDPVGPLELASIAADSQALSVAGGPLDTMDWGDAPDAIGTISYQTLAANNGARHIVNREFALGARVDTEPDGQPSSGATRDDTTETDDEDGVLFTSILAPGRMATVEVTATDIGRLDAWIDFEGDGHFDTGDQVFSSQPLTAGTNSLSFPVPLTAQPTLGTPTYARFRLSREGGLSAFGLARNGEVEDYAVSIQASAIEPVQVPIPWDWSVEVVSAAQDVPVWWDFVGLGEIAYQPPVNVANGDTFPLFVEGSDGVTRPNAVPAGAQWLIQFELVEMALESTNAEVATNDIQLSLRGEDATLPAGPSTGAMLVRNVGGELLVDGFFDVFTEMTFQDTQTIVGNPEAIHVNFDSDGTSPDDVIWVPASFWQEGLNNELLGGESPHALWGIARTVHTGRSRAFDWGDAPDRPYATLGIHGGALHRIRRGVHLGRRVDGEWDGWPTTAANGDDVSPTVSVDDEDGVEFVTPLIPGQVATVRVNASTNGWLNAWIDFDRDGVWEVGTPETLFSGRSLVAGDNLLEFTVPADAWADPDIPTYSRWRFSADQQMLRPEGAGTTRGIPDGEVEDHLLFLRPRSPDEQLDYGDAPDALYRTLLANDGARHGVDPEFYLGNLIDVDPDGAPSIAANGDDLNDGSDD
ncbi:MAG: hypothetical protein KDA60_13920 [Planctomycetales bacterium]|nr:hypothetical protein [Planctomycetales bacterium]